MNIPPTVDYSKIVDASGSPIWHTTVLTNGGWDNSYLPVLAKDHLVASAEIQNGVLAFANLYLGRYYLVERATGIVVPVDKHVDKALREIEGITQVEVSLEKKMAQVQLNQDVPDDVLKTAVEEAGYQVVSIQ